MVNFFLSLSDLSNQLLTIKALTDASLISSSNNPDPSALFSLVELCLKASLFVASGNYTVISEATTNTVTGPSVDMTSEDFCRKHGLKSTEESVRVYML